MSDSLRGFGAGPEMRTFGIGMPANPDTPENARKGRMSGSGSPGVRSGCDTIHSWISFKRSG
jgi:hypothetical protein